MTLLRAARPTALALGTSLALLAVSAPGCNKIMALVGGDKGAKMSAEADGLLQSGDLPGAADKWDEAMAAAPKSVDAASGAAYGLLLRGDTDGADAALAAAEASAGERLGEIKMRRALVALRAKDLDAVKEHGKASGMAAGKLLAAEAALADGEREEAGALLEEVKSAEGEVGVVASAYLDLIGNPDPLVAGLSEAQALWALGERKVAVKSVEELVKALPEEREDRYEQALVWAGRAASAGDTEVARSLLESVTFPPQGQAWRKVATAAIIACAGGDGDTCTRLFKSLEGSAPEDGLADAKATAAFLIATTSPDVATALAGPYVSNAAARSLYEAGARDAAKESAPGGILGDFLKAGG